MKPFSNHEVSNGLPPIGEGSENVPTPILTIRHETGHRITKGKALGVSALAAAGLWAANHFDIIHFPDIMPNIGEVAPHSDALVKSQGYLNLLVTPGESVINRGSVSVDLSATTFDHSNFKPLGIPIGPAIEDVSSTTYHRSRTGSLQTLFDNVITVNGKPESAIKLTPYKVHTSQQASVNASNTAPNIGVAVTVDPRGFSLHRLDPNCQTTGSGQCKASHDPSWLSIMTAPAVPAIDVINKLFGGSASDSTFEATSDTADLMVAAECGKAMATAPNMSAGVDQDIKDELTQFAALAWRVPGGKGRDIATFLYTAARLPIPVYYQEPGYPASMDTLSMNLPPDPTDPPKGVNRTPAQKVLHDQLAKKYGVASDSLTITNSSKTPCKVSTTAQSQIAANVRQEYQAKIAAGIKVGQLQK